MIPKRVAIVQSSYIPWKGYFDLMRRVDEFILYDDAQYTRRDWRNRNVIKTKDGLLWLTIPVEVRGKFHQAIKDVRVSDPAWPNRHFKSIAAAYARAPFFRDYRDAIEDLYRGAACPRLSDINRRFLQGLAQLLGITTPVSWSMDYDLPAGRVERLVALCRQAGATAYLSGPSARDYIDARLFAEAGIDLAFIDYSGYAEYPQLYPPFVHQVSALDLLLHTGADAAAYMLPA
ncbi:MAG: WbqC family protein [Actinobacteria bacterium]|nr:MAG: WbqC family protein [Actinomycetota bacterium]